MYRDLTKRIHFPGYKTLELIPGNNISGQKFNGYC